MGALVTLQLEADSPIRELPWIITFGPLTDDEDWEPVVCGPYEHDHALALAEEVVADEELMAVVEPLMGFAAPEEIRAEIAAARAAAIEAAAGPKEGDFDDENFDEDFDDDFDLTGEDDAGGRPDDGPDDEPDDEHAAPLPSPAEIRAGMARIAHRLSGQG